ncbi:unnamed protein product [marine sediment metagenome]|uniref:Uncharacterized protein n=1 Tax=marine sediment metagenome TaxID=412755 RepID=X0XSG9_9ZZZZ
MRFWVSRILVAVCSLLALSVERHVPLEYRTIQASIDASRTGGVIRIANGVYREDLVIGHKAEVTLRGDVSQLFDPDVPDSKSEPYAIALSVGRLLFARGSTLMRRHSGSGTST